MTETDKMSSCREIERTAERAPYNGSRMFSDQPSETALEVRARADEYRDRGGM